MMAVLTLSEANSLLIPKDQSDSGERMVSAGVSLCLYGLLYVRGLEIFLGDIPIWCSEH